VAVWHGAGASYSTQPPTVCCESCQLLHLANGTSTLLLSVINRSNVLVGHKSTVSSLQSDSASALCITMLVDNCTVYFTSLRNLATPLIRPLYLGYFVVSLEMFYSTQTAWKIIYLVDIATYYCICVNLFLLIVVVIIDYDNPVLQKQTRHSNSFLDLTKDH